MERIYRPTHNNINLSQNNFRRLDQVTTKKWDCWIDEPIHIPPQRTQVETWDLKNTQDYSGRSGLDWLIETLKEGI